MARRFRVGIVAGFTPDASLMPSPNRADGYTDSLPEGRNRVAELIRLAGSRGLKETAAMFASLIEWLSEPEHEGLIRAFWEWLRQVHLPAHCQGAELPPLENWREAGAMLNESVDDWTVPWREEGRVEGRVEGQIEVICRAAARKFDAATAERLTGRLAEIADPERVGEVGEWIIECEEAGDLLARVERLCGTASAGGCPSRG